MLTSLLKKVSISSDGFGHKIDLALAERSLYVVVQWSKGGPLKFHGISWKTKDGPWNQVLKTTKTSTSGLEQFKVGTVTTAVSLTISCHFEAFADIPQAVVLLIEDNPNLLLKREPATTFKALLNGENWNPKIDVDTI